MYVHVRTPRPFASPFFLSPFPPAVVAHTRFEYHFSVVAKDDNGIVAGDYNGLATISLKGLTLTELSKVAWTKDQPDYLGTIQVSGGSTPYRDEGNGFTAWIAYSNEPNTARLSFTGTPTKYG